jgi:hypothetical protein
MKRLVENELIYGRLLPVDEPHLVARYNKALRAFGLPETKLEKFRIDMTGFRRKSPRSSETCSISIRTASTGGSWF